MQKHLRYGLGWLLGALLGTGPLRAQSYLLPLTGTASYTTCAGTLYDDGGSTGPYSLNASGAVTLQPATPGNKIRLDFTQFALGAVYSKLVVYDGPTVYSPPLVTYGPSDTPGTLYATSGGGALTVQLVAGGGFAGSGFAANVSCVGRVPLPDLSVRNLRGVPAAAVAPGSPLSLSADVVNLSGGLAPPAPLHFYYSSDAVLSADDVLLDYRASGPLTAGAASSQGVYTAVPASAQAGQHYVLVVVDPANAVAESDEANNLVAVPLTILTPGPDLTTEITNLYSPGVPGSAVSISCTLRNQGTQTAAPATVGFYLSADSLLSANDQLLGYNATYPQLAAGSYPTVFGDGLVPGGTPPGRYYVLAVADYLQQVAETDETNNVSFRRLRVTAASLDVTILAAPLLVQPGQASAGSPVQLTSYVQNAGNVAANPVAVGYYLSTDPVLSSNDQPLAQVALGALYVGQQLPATYTATVPAGTAPGRYYVLAVADPFNQLAESDETNNVRAIPLLVTLPNVDLLLTNPVTAQPRPTPGSFFAVSATLVNAGTTAARPATVGYYLSDDDQLSPDDQMTGSSGYSVLNGGEQQGFSTLFNLSISAAPGRHYILFVADYRGEVAETNEANNVTALAIDVQPPRIDLVIDTPFTLTPNPVISGLAYLASCVITNRGSATSPTNRVGFYLSADAALDATDVLLNPDTGTLSYSWLLAGQSNTMRDAVTIPPGTAAGRYYLLAVADDLQQVAETDETNNVAALAITIQAPGPDLTVSASALASATTPAGTTVAATATLANVGSAVASESRLSFYLSANTTFELTDALLATTPGAALYAGQQSARAAGLAVPAGTAPGSYYVLAVADPLNTVAEGNEANNVAASALTVTAPFAGLVVPAAGAATATRCAGTVSDNGGGANYADDSRGELTISPGMAGSRVQLTFTLFDTELGADYLQVYDGPSAGAPLLATYTGQQVPGPVVASAANLSGALTLRFVSDGSVNGRGFEAAISCVQALAAGEQLGGATVSVLPNPVPAGGAVQVQLRAPGRAGQATLALLNVLGQVVARQPLPYGPGQPAAGALPVAGLAPGVYLLRLDGDGLHAVRRVVVQ